MNTAIQHATRYFGSSEEQQAALLTQQLLMEQHHLLQQQQNSLLQNENTHLVLQTQQDQENEPETNQQYENEELTTRDIDDASSTQDSYQQIRARSLDDQLCRGEMPALLMSLKNGGRNEDLIPMSDDSTCHESPVKATTHQSPSSSTLTLMKKQITEIEREIALKKPDGSLRRIGPEGEPLPPSLDLQLLDPLSK